MCCFLTLIFWGSGLDFGRSWANLGPNLGPNLVPDPQVKFKKAIFFAILGQLGPNWAKKPPQEAPRAPKWGQKVPREAPRVSKWSQKASQKSQNDAKKSATKPSHYQSKSPKTFSHQTGDTSNWWPTAPGFKRGGFQGRAPRGSQEGPRRLPGGSERVFGISLFEFFLDIFGFKVLHLKKESLEPHFERFVASELFF